MLNKKVDFNLKMFYVVYFGALGSFMPYVNVYLEKSIGLNGSQIGLLTALSQVVGFCFIPLWGVVGDKTRRFNTLLRVSLSGSLVMIFFYYKAHVYLAILICAIGLEVLRLGATPLADTISTNYCHKTNGNYGSIRSMGALGYMLASMLVGFLADKIGLDGPLFATYGFLLIIALPLTFGFPKDTPKEKGQASSLKKGSFKELVTNKNFIFILVITILTSVIVDSSMTFAGNHLITTLHGSPSLISWVSFITILPEVWYLSKSQKVINKLGFKKYYILVVLSIIIRCLVYTFTGNVYAFLIAGVVHGLGVSIVTVGNLEYIRRTVEPSVLGTAITLLNAAVSMGMAVFGYIFGIVYQYTTSYMIYAITLGAVVLALLLLIRTKSFDTIDKDLEEKIVA